MPGRPAVILRGMALYQPHRAAAADRRSDRGGGVRRLGRRGDGGDERAVDPGRRGPAGRDLRPRPAVRLPVAPPDARDPRRPADVAGLARGHPAPRPVQRPRPAGPDRQRARRPLAPAGRRRRRDPPGPRRARLDQPRRDPGRRSPHAAGADPGHRIRGRPVARRRDRRPDGHPPRAVGGAVDARDRGLRRGHPGGRLLRPDPALRPGPLRAAAVELHARGRAPPRRRAPARRPRRRGARSCATGSTPRPRPTTRPASTSSASRRWSTSRGCPRATT